MRILLLIPLIDSYRCFLRELCAELTRQGHEVHVWCNRDGNTLGVDPVLQTPGSETVAHFPFPRGASLSSHLRAARSLRSGIKTLQPDLIHAHFSAAMLTLALAKQGQPWFPLCFGTVQGLAFPPLSGSRRFLMRQAETFAASAMNRCEVLTPDDLQALRDCDAELPVFLQPGFGFGCADRFLDTPRPSETERNTLRESLGIPTDSVCFLFSGRQVSFKGFGLLIRAFLSLAETRADLRLMLVGARDPLHSDGLPPELRDRMMSHPAILHAGIQSDVLPWMDAADALVLPTLREGMPVGVMEALARGLPVLTHPVRGCRELIQERINGHFFPRHTMEAIAGTLNRFKPGRLDTIPEHLRRSHWIHQTLLTYDDLTWQP